MKKPKALPAGPVRSFRSAREFRRWLASQHARVEVLLLRIYKKASGVATVTYAEALDEALCYGWIDGLRLPLDEHSYLQRFTPRRPGSGWSKLNTHHAERLIRTGARARSTRRSVAPMSTRSPIACRRSSDRRPG